jgi:hypothetical protein
MLVAEGEVFNLSGSVDVTGISGTPTATVVWGDGTQSPATVTGGTTTGNIRIRFDYSLDTSGFFNAPERRNVLNAAANTVVSRLTDTLSAIQPSGTNTWTANTLHPVTNAQVTFTNPTIAANELVVYVGARRIGGNELGFGGPGGFSARGSTDWLNTVSSRGETGALASPPTDFGPWGGTISFDSAANWYFGTDVAGLQPNQTDFLTVAAHELVHVLGFGTVPSWTRFVSGSSFTGPKARAAHDAGGNVPVIAGHWPESLTDGGRKTLMGPIIAAGQRELLTGLDLAALDDMGWDTVDTRATVTAQHTYPDNGNYPITINLRGSTAGLISTTTSATITNVIPTLTVIANQTAIRDQPLRITNIGGISDPGFSNPAATPPTVETFTYTINWGDGTTVDSGSATIDRNGNASAPTLASFDGTHTYTAAGTYTVTVRVSDDDNGAVQRTFQVVVSNPPQLTLTLNRNSIAENQGASAATLTISRSGPAVETPTTVNLSSSDPSEATVPASVVIPANQTSITVPVNAVDDALLDGTQQVTLSGTSSGLTSGSVVLSVTDHEALTSSFTAAAIFENAATGSFFLTVRRPNTDNTQPLAVSIAGNVPSRLTVPTSATIPAGSQEVRIPVQPIDNDTAQRPLVLVYRASATGYVSTERELTLIDDEPPLFQNQEDRFNVDGRGDVLPLDALRVINAISRRGTNFILDPATDDFGDIFPDVNGDYQLTALDALLIINEISRRNRQGSSSGEASPPDERRETATDRAITDLMSNSLF